MEQQHTKQVEALERVERFLEQNRAAMERMIPSKAHQNLFREPRADGGST